MNRICNNIASLIPGVDNLFLYSGFPGRPGKWFMNFFENNELFFHWFLFIVYLFSVSLISTLIFISDNFKLYFFLARFVRWDLNSV